MANHTGNGGVVKIGSGVVAELSEWSLDETGETVDTSVMGVAARSHKPTLTSATGSINCYWDETDTAGQGAMTPNASVTINLYPEGAASSATYKTMTATITGVGLAGSNEGMVTQNFTFQVNGAVTEATVA